MNKIELIRPKHGATTEPLQQYSNSSELKLTAAQNSADSDESFSPVRSDANPELDRSRPKPVRFEWKPVHAGSEGWAYDLLISETPDFKRLLAYRNTAGPTCDVSNLKIGKRYFWKVIGRNSNGGESLEAPAWHFNTDKTLPRWIYGPGITNVRDLGGWPL